MEEIQLSLQPLKGITVIDWTEGVAGPLASQMLGDLGAEIIKVESPIGDWGRVFNADTSGYNPSFYALNRNKRNICIDSKQAQSQKITKKMIEYADVMITNYRPGVMERLGLEFNEMRKCNPDLIYGRISAYGYHGKYSKLPGSDTVLQAVSGFMNQIGDKDTTPYRVGIPIIDITAAKDMVIGILSGVLMRTQGITLEDPIDVNLFASAAALQIQSWQQFFETNDNPPRSGNENPSLAPGGIYQTADNKAISVVVLHDRHWHSFCNALSLEQIINNDKFITNAARINNREKLDHILIPLFKDKTQKEWLAFFQKTDLLIAPVNELSDISEDIDLLDIIPKTYVQQDDNETIKPTIGLPISVGQNNNPDYKQAASSKGEHTKEILSKIGFDNKEIDSFILSETVYLSS